MPLETFVTLELNSASQAQSGKSGESKQGKSSHPNGDQEVRGFMTLNEISLKTGVPKDWLLKRLGLSTEIDPRQPVREWMHSQGKSIQDVRQAVADFRAGTR